MSSLEPWLVDLVYESGTPHFVFDLHIVRKQIGRLRQLLPNVTLLYSTKTNSSPAILDTCISESMEFDAATIGEIDMLLERGVKPTAIVYTHPVKTPAEVQRAYTSGVRHFTCDTLNELAKLHINAPNGRFFVRLAPGKNASVYNYQHRLGASPSEVRQILDYAVEQNIQQIVGLSFHVGSQSMRVAPWAKALKQCRKLVIGYYHKLPSLRRVNIGSGFPLDYGFGNPPTMEMIARRILKELQQFPDDVSFLAEPGRVVVGPAGTLIVSIVERLQRGKQEWLFTDATVYSGLIEPLESGGRFTYPISSLSDEKPLRSFKVAGKTLDPDDIIGKDVEITNNIAAGDLLLVEKCGAYSLEFFTTYHQLPYPLVSYYDSQHADKVQISQSSVAHKGIHTKLPLQAGDTIFSVTGYHSKKRSRTSFQINENLHVEPTLFGAYLNHSCGPNAGIRTSAGGLLNVVAREPIAAGEEVTVDYAMFEYELADMAKVPCRCNTPDCRERILGYKHLPEHKKEEYRSYMATHLTHRENA